MAATARRSSSRSKGFSMQGWLEDAKGGLQVAQSCATSTSADG